MSDCLSRGEEGGTVNIGDLPSSSFDYPHFSVVVQFLWHGLPYCHFPDSSPFGMNLHDFAIEHEIRWTTSVNIMTQ